jgi:hypothetical protein
MLRAKLRRFQAAAVAWQNFLIGFSLLIAGS